MKQSEIKVGESYLFHSTCVEHRKFMEGMVVEVISKRKGKKKYPSFPNYSMQNIGRCPMRLKLNNGENANAGELRKI